MPKAKAKAKKSPKQPPPGMIDAADDLMFDMENSPPDPDEYVIRVEEDGSLTTFPASELDPKDW